MTFDVSGKKKKVKYKKRPVSNYGAYFIISQKILAL